MLRSPGFPLLLVLFLNVSACGGSSNSPSNPSPNAAPTVMDDAGNSDNGRAVTLAVLANDSSPVGSALQVSGYTNPAHGVLTLANGVFTYVPDAGYYGQDQFRYTASDRNNRSASAQVTIQSRIKLNLRGIVEGQVMGAQVRHSANDDLISSSGVGGRFSIELVTTDADAVLQLEARGVGSDSFIRYAVLLGTAKRLLASVRDPQSATPTLDAEHYARLNLGAIGTAEYGMLRELANTDDLL